MLTINDLAQSKLRSSSLDKLHGQKKAIELHYEGDEVYDVSDDARTEEVRQRLEKATGKTIYVIDKGGFFVDEFFDSISESNPTEVIDINGDFEEIKFTDFSLYHVKGFTYSPVFMDAREIILPPKSEQSRGLRRLYILAYDGKLYNLPELEYPRTIVPFLKWLKKKKKLSYTSSPMVWNGDKKIYDNNGDLSWIDICCGGASYGYPIKNLKTKEDIREYNTWLLGEYKTKVEAHNKINKYTNLIVPVTKLNPTELSITQSDVDQFINEWNNKYQVKR